MKVQCVSIRGKTHPGERCTHPAIQGEWCGLHAKQRDPRRFTVTAPGDPATLIARTWRRYMTRKHGPLLYCRELSNNVEDFFSTEPITTLPIRDFVSFVEKGRGYCMDIKSAVSLIDHDTCKKSGAINPFTREPLSRLFLRRIERMRLGTTVWQPLEAEGVEQRFALAVADLFRAIEDLNYYVDPEWFLLLTSRQLRRMYIELSGIWHLKFKRAGINTHEKLNLLPGNEALIKYRTAEILLLPDDIVRTALLEAGVTLICTPDTNLKRNTGAQYFLGALTLVSPRVARVCNWLEDMFYPRLTAAVGDGFSVADEMLLLF